MKEIKSFFLLTPLLKSAQQRHPVLLATTSTNDCRLHTSRRQRIVKLSTRFQARSRSVTAPFLGPFSQGQPSPDFPIPALRERRSNTALVRCKSAGCSVHPVNQETSPVDPFSTSHPARRVGWEEAVSSSSVFQNYSRIQRIQEQDGRGGGACSLLLAGTKTLEPSGFSFGPIKPSMMFV